MFKYTAIILLVIAVIKGQEICQFNTTTSGECLGIKECDFALDLLKKGMKTQICRYNNYNPIVCCPKNRLTTRSLGYGEIAKQKCEEIKSNYEYKNFGFVFGGVDARSQEFLHMAALGYGDINAVQWLCGGSLISDRFVLSAAHCVANKIGDKLRWVRLGDLDLNSTSDEAEPVDYGIKSTFIHPDFKPPSKYNDIALIELDRPVKYTKYIKPACIETEDNIETNKTLHATGWGIVKIVDNTRLSHLQDVELFRYSHEECRSAYGSNNNRRLKNGIIESHICAGGRNNLKDTCSGDSGGPLQYTNSNGFRYRGYTIVGVTSFGKICGLTRSPGVYTKVSSFVPWIESIVWPNN